MKKPIGKGFEKKGGKVRKINASTIFEKCLEHITPFGGILGLIKFLDLVQFEEIFEHFYNNAPVESPAGQLSYIWS